MNIDGVSTGIILDHIHAGKSMDIYHQLKLNELECSVAIIQNASSNKYGKKDIIKIDQIIDLDFDVLGYIDPNITVNICQDGKLLSKEHMELPDKLLNVISCKNPRCITSIEHSIPQRFRLTNPEKKEYRCEYCDVSYKEKR